jgi:hypothetical protein
MSSVLPLAKTAIAEASKQLVALQMIGGELTQARSNLERLVSGVDAQLTQVINTTPADRKAMQAFVNGIGESVTAIAAARIKEPANTQHVSFPIGTLNTREEVVVELVKQVNADGNDKPMASFWETLLVAYPKDTVDTVTERADSATAEASALAQILVSLQARAHKVSRESPWA